LTVSNNCYICCIVSFQPFIVSCVTECILSYISSRGSVVRGASVLGQKVCCCAQIRWSSIHPQIQSTLKSDFTKRSAISCTEIKRHCLQQIQIVPF